MICPECGGTGVDPHQDAIACRFCNGAGEVGGGEEPKTQFITERYNVSGNATERVLVKWPDGTVHTLYRPAQEG